MFSWWNNHRSVHCNGHRTRSGTCCLIHKPSFDSTFQLSLRNSANLCGLLCAAHVPSLFPGFAHCTLRRAPTAWRLVFLKYKMLHKTLKPRDTSEGFINARLGSVFRQDYNAWVDRAGCCPEQKLELCHLTTKF